MTSMYDKNRVNSTGYLLLTCGRIDEPVYYTTEHGNDEKNPQEDQQHPRPGRKP